MEQRQAGVSRGGEQRFYVRIAVRQDFVLEGLHFRFQRLLGQRLVEEFAFFAELLDQLVAFLKSRIFV